MNISKIVSLARHNRVLLLVLASIVVSITTYSLILPAFTLEKKTAERMGGIDVETKECAASVEYDRKAAIPDDAELKLEEIKSGKDFDSLYSKTKKALEKGSGVKADIKKILFYDISIMSGEDEVEPDSPVTVSIDFNKDIDLGKVNNGKISIIHFKEDSKGNQKAELLDDTDFDVEIKKNQLRSATFEAESFSVYAIVYTVDFHWEVNGKMYDFSIPGGGFVSFTDLVEVLGIAGQGGIEDFDGEVYDSESMAEGSGADGNEEVSTSEGGSAEADGSEAAVTDSTDAPLTLGDITVSDETRQFVKNVESVVPSSSELLSVSKADHNTTVGAIKDGLSLVCEYSAELTEEQIAEINATEVESGDWAVISIKPFSSTEYLTVTMKTGEVFTIKVTDAQISTHVLTASGDTYKITVTYDDRAEIPDNAELRAREITEEDEEYQKLCDEADQALIEKYDNGLENPILFDIGIYVDDEEIEPAEGSTVKVEIWLANELAENLDEENAATSEKNIVDDVKDNADYAKGAVDDDNDESGIYLNGERIDGNAEQVKPVIVHLESDGDTEIIDSIDAEKDDKGDLTITFETDSFSKYVISDSNGLNSLPDVLYVSRDEFDGVRYGDELYFQNFNINGYTLEGGYQFEQRGANNYNIVKLDHTGTLVIKRNNQVIKPIRVEYYPEANTKNPSTVTNQVTNESAGITLDLFDYDLDGVLNEEWNPNAPWNAPTDVKNYYLNHGINSGKILKFWTSCPGYDDKWNNGWTNNGNFRIAGIVDSTLGENNYPTVTKETTTQSLDYLFDPTKTVNDRKTYANADKLFKYDKGYYIYNSDDNYAWFNRETNSFEVYDSSYQYNVSGKNTDIGFFPFHPYNDSEYETSLDTISRHQIMNHHFGISMSAKFAIPSGGKDQYGQDIIYEFSGDDDMWVFIDKKLAMDIGGIHQPVHGIINFSQIDQGKATVRIWAKNNGAELYNGEITDLVANKEYTLRSFYLERGGGDSNCMIKFNLPTYRTLKLAKRLNGLSANEYAKYKDEWFTYELVMKTGTDTDFTLYKTPDEARKTAQNPDPNYDLRPLIRNENGDIIGARLNANGEADKDEDGNYITELLKDSEGNVKQGVSARWLIVDNGQIKLKDGWVVEIPHLSRSDSFYVAEEKTINMDEFEDPHAEREFFTNSDGQHHEEEIDLSKSTTQGENQEEHKQLADWKTGNMTLQETEKVTFTNTLKEKNIDVEKDWSDGKDAHANDSITFQVIATINRNGENVLYSDVHEDAENTENNHKGRIWGLVTGEVEQVGNTWTELDAHTEQILQHTYTLNAKNDWKMSFEHLPAVTENDEVITYSVVERQGVTGYTAADPTFVNSYDIDVFKYFPDDSYPDETITFHLKKGDLYYKGSNDGTGNYDDSAWGSKSEAHTFTLSKNSVQEDSYHCRFKDMPDGDYSIEQIDSTNPLTEGLAIYKRSLKKFTILNEKKITISVKKDWDPVPDASENPSVTVELHRYAKKTSGVLSVTLKDNNGAAIQGAVFEVYKLNDETDEFDATDTTVTTDVNGIASVSNLAPGQYKLVQQSTPEGYRMDGHTTESGVLTVEDNKVTPQEQNTDLVNTALVTAGQVTLTVTDSGAGSGTAGTPVQGAVFTLYKDGNVYSTGHTTDASGEITVGMLPAGTYYFEQTGFTAGSVAEKAYKLPTGNDAKTAGFTIEDKPGQKQEKTQSLTNSLKGKGTVSLTLKKDNGTAISGASFQLKQGDTVLETKTTGSDGTLAFATELYEGTYTVHQVDTGSAGADYSVAADQTVVTDANSVTNQQKSLSFVNEEASVIYTLTLRSSSDNLSVLYYYKRGTAVTLTFDNGNDYYDPYDGIVLSGDVSGTIHGHRSSFPVTMNSNKTITLTSTGNSNWSNVVTNALKVSPTPEANINSRMVSRQLSSLPTINGLYYQPDQILSTTANGEAVTHSDASPASAPAGYTEDTTFTPIQLTLSGGTWTGTFPAQEKTDANGDPYYYYVVETSCTPSDYFVESYTGDPLSDTGTITIRNKRSEKGQLTVTKQVLYNDAIDTEAGTAETPATFNVAIFTKDGENYTQVGSTKAISVVAGVTTEAAVFTDLDMSTTYYVFEMDGTTRVGETFGTYTVTNSGASFTPSRENANGSVQIINALTESGSLKVKKQVQKNGTNTAVTEAKTFKIGLYKVTMVEASGESTEMEAFVESKDVSVSAGADNAEVIFRGLEVGARYRVYEMDGEDKIEANGSLGDYTVTYDSNQTIEIERASKDAGETTVTNNEKALDLDIVKVDKNDTTKKLPNAVFTVSLINESVTANSPTKVTGTGARSYTGTTDDKGEAHITGLKPGYYEVEETTPPAGYVKTGTGKFYIHVDETVTLVEWDSTEAKWKEVRTSGDVISFTNTTATVQNEPGVALPSTGGPGTTALYLLGSILITMAGAGLVMRRKRDAA